MLQPPKPHTATSTTDPALAAELYDFRRLLSDAEAARMGIETHARYPFALDHDPRLADDLARFERVATEARALLGQLEQPQPKPQADTDRRIVGTATALLLSLYILTHYLLKLNASSGRLSN